MVAVSNTRNIPASLCVYLLLGVCVCVCTSMRLCVSVCVCVCVCVVILAELYLHQNIWAADSDVAGFHPSM